MASAIPQPLRFEFPTPALSWVVLHGLGHVTLIQLFDTSGVEIQASLVNYTDSEARVTFAEPTAGYVLVF